MRKKNGNWKVKNRILEVETRKVQPEAHELKDEKQFDLYRREKDQNGKE